MQLGKKKVFVAGHRGMVGSAIVRSLENCQATDLIVAPRSDLNLLDQSAVQDFFDRVKPEIVYLAAAKVGGIHANNTYPADFIYENLVIQANVINASYRSDVQRLLFLGSSCIYPKNIDSDIHESDLLSGCLEKTNEPYAVAKIAGIKLCESYNRQFGTDFRSVMPTNLYGPGDNYHPQNSHVIPGLIHRFHTAKINQNPVVKVWGSGNPRREFLFVDDLAEACKFIMAFEKAEFEKFVSPMQSHLNVGTGHDIKISELAEIVSKTVGYQGKIEFDLKYPDGTMRKLLNVSQINTMGWSAGTDLTSGLQVAYHDYIENYG